jgi:hypothetical protein
MSNAKKYRLKVSLSRLLKEDMYWSNVKTTCEHVLKSIDSLLKFDTEEKKHRYNDAMIVEYSKKIYRIMENNGLTTINTENKLNDLKQNVIVLLDCIRKREN